MQPHFPHLPRIHYFNTAATFLKATGEYLTSLCVFLYSPKIITLHVREIISPFDTFRWVLKTGKAPESPSQLVVFGMTAQSYHMEK